MTIQEAYTQFLLLVNRNATNNKVNVDRFRFIKMFNYVQNRYVEWVLDKRNEDSIRDIQKLLVVELPLLPSASTQTVTSFRLPDNYFNFTNISALADSDCCKNERLLVYEVKSEDTEEKYNDKYSEPSFEWRETYGYTSSNTFIVYKKDFELTKIFLTYYRYPIQVDIEGYEDEFGNVSSNVDPEFDDKVVGRILLAMAKEFSAINGDTTDFQLTKERLFNI